MKITQAQVAQTAALAHLQLPPEALARTAEELARILDYMDLLNSLGTDGAQPQDRGTAQVDYGVV